MRDEHEYQQGLTKLIKSMEADERAEQENKPCGLSFDQMMKEFK